MIRFAVSEDLPLPAPLVVIRDANETLLEWRREGEVGVPAAATQQGDAWRLVRQVDPRSASNEALRSLAESVGPSHSDTIVLGLEEIDRRLKAAREMLVPEIREAISREQEERARALMAEVSKLQNPMAGVVCYEPAHGFRRALQWAHDIHHLVDSVRTKKHRGSSEEVEKRNAKDREAWSRVLGVGYGRYFLEAERRGQGFPASPGAGPAVWSPDDALLPTGNQGMDLLKVVLAGAAQRALERAARVAWPPPLWYKVGLGREVLDLRLPLPDWTAAVVWEELGRLDFVIREFPCDDCGELHARKRAPSPRQKTRCPSCRRKRGGSWATEDTLSGVGEDNGE